VKDLTGVARELQGIADSMERGADALAAVNRARGLMSSNGVEAELLRRYGSSANSSTNAVRRSFGKIEGGNHGMTSVSVCATHLRAVARGCQ
jgi:hypothetical protein